MRVAAIIALLGVVATGRATAQRCAGLPSFTARPIRISAAAVSHSYVAMVRGGISVGRTAFATVSAGHARDDELDAEAFDIDVDAGFERTGGEQRQLFFCPVVGYRRTFGPDGYVMSAMDRRFTEGRLGASMGFVLRRASIDVVPTVGLRIHWLHMTEQPNSPFSVPRSAGDNYATLALGVGLTAGRWTVRPMLDFAIDIEDVGADPLQEPAVPFGRKRGEKAIGVMAAVSF